MIITRCDLCKKEIKKEPITAGFGFSGRKDLCQNCGLPVLNFLKKHKFIKEELKNKSQKT